MHMSNSAMCKRIYYILIVMLYNSEKYAAFYYSPYYVAKNSGKFSYNYIVCFNSILYHIELPSSLMHMSCLNLENRYSVPNMVSSS